MNLNYHPDTDSLYIGLSPNPSAESNEAALETIRSKVREIKMKNTVRPMHEYSL